MTQVVITQPVVSVVEVNTGTQGPPGPAGATGPAGPSGATGAAGATGAQGPAGTADGPMTVVTSGTVPSAPSAGSTQLTPIEYVPGWRDLLMMDEDSSVSFVRRWMRGATEFSWAPFFKDAGGFAAPTGMGIDFGTSGNGGDVQGLAHTSLGYRQRLRHQMGGTFVGTGAGIFSGGYGFPAFVHPKLMPSQNVSGIRYGGYFVVLEFAFENDPDVVAAFAGVTEIVPGGAASPITRPHHAGISYEDSAAAGSAMRFTRNDGSASGTAVTLTAGNPGVVNTLNRGTFNPIVLTLFSPPEEDALGVRIDLVTAPRSITPIYRALHTTQIPTTPSGGQSIEVAMVAGAPFASAAGIMSVYRCFGWQGG